MKNAVFWDVTSCGSCNNWRFGGTQRLHHQGDKNRWARDVSLATDACCEEIQNGISPKHRFLQEPHGVTSQKTAFFKSPPWKPWILHVNHYSCWLWGAPCDSNFEYITTSSPDAMEKRKIFSPPPWTDHQLLVTQHVTLSHYTSNQKL
jgi:hypothetical protein